MCCCFDTYTCDFTFICLNSISWLVFIMDRECIHCEVRTEVLHCVSDVKWFSVSVARKFCLLSTFLIFVKCDYSGQAQYLHNIWSRAPGERRRLDAKTGQSDSKLKSDGNLNFTSVFQGLSYFSVCSYDPASVRTVGAHIAPLYSYAQFDTKAHIMSG